MKIPVTNVSGEDRWVGTLGLLVPAGETVLVDQEAAGRAPSGEPGDDGHDPGVGLLAQPDNWAPGDRPKTRRASAADQSAAADEEG